MKQTIVGISIVVAGVILLLANLGLYNIRELVEVWWPIALVVIGGLLLLNERKDYTWSILFSLLGLFFLARNLELFTVNIAQIFWPGVIIAVGLSLLIGGSRIKKRTSKKDEDEVVSILSGIDQRNSTSDFKGCNITTVMGGATLDITKATIKKEATITVLALMGGIEIQVPKDVIVKTRTTSMLGGIDDKSISEAKATSPVLYIDGTVIMGGVEIKRS